MIQMWQIAPFMVFTLLINKSLTFDRTLEIDFPGPHCAKIGRCCQHREDNCSLPLADTLCYCDDFCERTDSSDCCPDYYSFCQNSPKEIKSCYHNGQYFSQDSLTKENCNECRCQINGNVECENDLCLTDEKIVNYVNNLPSLGWSARLYKEWWGRKYSDGITLRLGTFKPEFHIKKRLTNKAQYLPDQFNVMNEWSILSDVMDQGWCGADWAISTASVASDRFAIHSNGSEIVKLSAQQIMSCTTQQKGCLGGHLDSAWRFLHTSGVVDEDCFPYEAAQETCRVNMKDRSLKKNGCRTRPGSGRDDFYKVGPAYALKDEVSIMSEIYKIGPVQATMRVYRDFFSYSHGVYKYTGVHHDSPSGFHSVKLVGWGQEPNGMKYWIAANSWGKNWGENGYFRILRGVNECGIEDYVIAAWSYWYVRYPTQKPSIVRT